MLISRASKVAIIALADLASRNPNHWTSADELCQSIGADLPFLRQIMNRLSAEGIVRSKKGRRGGFQIVVPADKLSLAQIIQAIEGSDCSGKCLLSSETCGGAAPCLLAATWHPVREILLDFLDSETIEKVVERSVGRIDRFGVTALNE